MQLKYCQNLDFEAGPINKFKTLIIKTSSFDFKIDWVSLYKTQLKYCQKLDFEAGPINKFKTLILYGARRFIALTERRILRKKTRRNCNLARMDLNVLTWKLLGLQLFRVFSILSKLETREITGVLAVTHGICTQTIVLEQMAQCGNSSKIDELHKNTNYVRNKFCLGSAVWAFFWSHSLNWRALAFDNAKARFEWKEEGPHKLPGTSILSTSIPSSWPLSSKSQAGTGGTACCKTIRLQSAS